MKVNLSFVIPVYNAGNLLRDALDSILNQKFCDIEVILVDDSSSDVSPDICMEYSAKDSRVNYLRIPNGGPSKARNFGLDHAKGEYVYFFDQDDYLVNTDCIDYIMERIRVAGKTDVIIFKYQEYFNEGKFINHRPNYPIGNNKQGKYPISVALAKFDQIGVFPISPWDKIIKKSFLLKNGILFPEGKVANDILWFLDLMINVNDLLIINEVVYTYRKQLSSSLSSSLSAYKFANLCEVIEESVDLIKNKAKDDNKKYFMSFLSYWYVILLSLRHKLESGVYLKYKERVEDLSFLLSYGNNPKVRRARMLFSLFGANFGSKILGFYITKMVNRH